jgi:YVTN family beta-propeller protein
VTNLQSSTVSRIDPATDRATATIAAQAEPACAVAAGGAVWVACPNSRQLVRIPA